MPAATPAPPDSASKPSTVEPARTIRPAPRDSADVGRARERSRQRRLGRVVLVLGPLAAFLWLRLLAGDPVGMPTFPAIEPLYLMAGLFFVVLIVVLLGTTVVAGRSPHITYRPEQIDVRLDDVKGLAPVKEDVTRSLDLFLAGRTFRREMGGTPRRGLLFEGAPGTGKTHMAKAMAAEAGVPFLFVSGTSFQSMYYGATARKIRSYFKALRKAARTEGGAIGFIEEIDAIATVRGGMSATPAPTGLAPARAELVSCGGLEGLPVLATRSATAPDRGSLVSASITSEGVGGVVNELLVQMQSFDEPTGWQKVQSKATDVLNLFLPAHRQVPRPRPEPVDVLLIAATNRADNLDPALLRPGRFDRRLTFDLPDKAGRREIIDHFLARKAHGQELDDDERRDALAGVTQGYSPVMIEHLMDEALVNAVRRGAAAMSWRDLEQARLVVEVGLGQPVGYTEHEKRLIATHEAGHATIAHLVAPHRRLEILTIVKRASALGLLAHGDADDVYTRSRSELADLIKIAFGGQVAEELFFGDVSTGPGGDLQYATGVAAQMVGAAGMCDTLISFAAVQGSALSGNDLVGRVLGDSEGRRMVEGLLREQKEHVRRLMGANRHLVEALRDALLDRHELIGHEITDVLAAAGPARPAPPLESTAVGASTPQTIDLVALERDVQQGTTKGANPPRT
ncbi:MAG TPA: AAA family ATPase [Actinomycetales bacterium]|nr:AAA family ATPase [Actinomycetales bacterium]